MVLKNFGTDVINLAKNYNTLNIMSDKQVVSVERLTKRLNLLKDNGNLTTKSITELYKSIESLNSDSLTYYFQSVAEGAENARVNIVDAYAAILDGNTHGLKNVQSIMNTFNNSFDGSVEKQKEFTKAVGQSNKGLANYLNSIEAGGTATLKGYAGQLVKTTAKTVLLTAKTIALQAALSAGLTWIISLVVQGFNNLITAEQNLIDTANETAEKVEEEVNALEQLRQKYIEVCDSADDEVAKNEKLNEIKQELVDTYGFEREAIEQLNLERQKGLDLLDSEIEKKTRITRNDWLKTNEKAVKNANFNLGNTLTGKSVYSNTTNNGGISDTILNLFDNKNISDGFVRLSFDMDDIVDGLNKTKDIYNEILEIQSRRNLTEDELSLLNKVKSDLDYLQDLYDKYYETYSTAAKYNVQNLVENYLETDEGKLESVGKDTFKSWSNGLIKQAENAEQKRQIQKYIEDVFPDYAKYFNNLERAKKQFGALNPNSEYEARKSDFLEKLSPEDLEIATKIPKLFADGLAGATAKIEAWKKDPNNVIKPTVDTKPLSELAEEISSKTKLINTAIDDMNDTGHISASTYAEIIEMGGNFADCLEIQNGQLVLNTERLKELETEEYNAAISANKLAIAHKALGINSKYDYEEWQKFKNQLEEENALYQILIDEIYGANGSENKGKTDNTDYIKQAFDKDMAEAEHLHNMGLMSDEEYWNALEKANNDHYKNSLDHQSEYNTNLEKIFNGRKELYKNAADDEASFLDEQLEKGFITAEEYREKMIGLAEKYYGQDSKYYDTDFATENFELLEDKALKADDQIYEDRLKALKETEGDSLESHNEFIAEWKALNEEIYEAPNPKKYKENLDEIEKYDKEYIENRNKKLANDEKSYWEWQKEQVETYYDNELKKLQEITDQEERISKQKELQLKLMKAQDDLLKAKKNRNQLVFSNGGWEYDYNQDDIISKMETVADAEKDIADNQKENQKDDLEKKKEEALSPFKDILKAISDYIDKLNGNIIPTESNPEVLDAVAKNAEQVQKDDKKRAESLPTVTLESFLQDMGFKYNKEVVSAGYNLYEKVIGNSLSIPNEIAKSFSGTTYNNCTINKGISINNPSFSLIRGVSETKVRDIFDEEITNAFNIISDRIETEAIRVGNE